MTCRKLWKGTESKQLNDELLLICPDAFQVMSEEETAALESVKTRSKIRRYVIIGIVVVVALAAVVVAAKLYGGNLHLSGGGTFDFHIS